MQGLIAAIDALDAHETHGRVRTVQGLLLEIAGPMSTLEVGGRVVVESAGGARLGAEIVGFRDNYALCLPFGPLDGVRLGCRAVFKSHAGGVRPGPGWLGRVVNAEGEPIDGKGPVPGGGVLYPFRQQALPAHERVRVGGPLDMGVRALNTFTTLCEGQRMGIFAGSGVGKSVLMSMLTRNADCDVAVIGLIGERGREVQEFIVDYLGDALERAVVVVATSDEAALMRRQAAYLTLSLAEYFRDSGKRVLCMMDSLTRFAQAQREIGLSVGEPPTAKGYPPTVFNELPKLLERAGPGLKGSGSITGLFTVLVEGDDHNEPIADAVRGILDGHIVMERGIAERGR